MELFRDKVTELDFALNLEGNTSPPQASLIAEFGNYQMKFQARIEEDTAKVSIPALKDILKNIPESAHLKLEVMIEGAYFVPWEDTGTFKKSISVGVTEAVVRNSEITKSPSPSVQLKEKPIKSTPHPLVEKKSSKTVSISEFFKQLDSNS